MHGRFEQHNMLKLKGDLSPSSSHTSKSAEVCVRRRGVGGGDLDPSTVSFSQVNKQCWEMRECNSTHETNQQKYFRPHSFWVRTFTHSFVMFYLNRLVKWIQMIFHICPCTTSSRSKYYLWTATTEKSESCEPVYFTVGFRKDNAWHSPPLLHRASLFLSPLP